MSDNDDLQDDFHNLSIAGESYSENISNLSKHFRELIDQMIIRVNQLSQQAHSSVLNTQVQLEKREFTTADAQIESLKSILKLCDQLEDEFVKIKLIGEFAKNFNSRMNNVEKELDAL